MLRSGFRVSERRACRVLKQPRMTQRYAPVERDDEVPLTKRIIELAAAYGRYGYRRITALLHLDAWCVNYKRVERIWRQQGLKVPKKQPKRRRLWLNDGSCVRLRPTHKDHVWAYDFVQDRTARRSACCGCWCWSTSLRRECLAIDVGPDRIDLRGRAGAARRGLDGDTRGVPEHIRSATMGPSSPARRCPAVAGESRRENVVHRAGFSPWENGYVEILQRQSCGMSYWIGRFSIPFWRRRC